MKVVQLVMARQYRGAEIFAAQLSRALVTQGADVSYVALYRNEGKELIPVGVNYHDIDAPKSSGFNLFLIRNLSKWFKQHSPDIVQANAGDTLKYAVLIKLIYGFRYKIIFRNASMVSRYIRSYPHRLFNSFLYRHVDYVVSVSKSSNDDLIKLFPICKLKSEVVPIGIEMKRFARLSVFSSELINLVHVGGFTFEKNHAGLLRIFKAIRDRNENTHLWLVGDGPMRKRIEEEVERSELSKAVTFTGAVENILDYIASADVLLLPSMIEGLPGVILEAFYCKTPVVAYDVGGIGEIVKNRETGLLIKKEDEEVFAAGVMDVLNDSVLMGKIIEQAHSLVTAKFDNHEIAKLFAVIYNRVLCR